MRTTSAWLAGLVLGVLGCSSTAPNAAPPLAGTPCGDLLTCCTNGGLESAVAAACVNIAYEGGDTCAEAYTTFNCVLDEEHANTVDNEGDDTSVGDDGSVDDDSSDSVGSADDDSSSDTGDDDDGSDSTGGDDDSSSSSDTGDDDGSDSGDDDGSGSSFPADSCEVLSGCCQSLMTTDEPAVPECESIAASGDPNMCEPAQITFCD